MDLPIITDCNDCGACCMEQSSPPAYIGFMSGAITRERGWPDDEDFDRFESAPPEAIDAIQQYIDRSEQDGWRDGIPCCWFDLETKRCKFYEHRPQICRDLEIGSEGCRAWRDKFNIKAEAPDEHNS